MNDSGEFPTNSRIPDHAWFGRYDSKIQMRQYTKAHFPIAAIARADEFYE